ncbi:MAG: hypothetical protein H8F28_27020 [Fibrella sp.]|nr:hypothetical protein [Armatimonadota bacterium]
MTTQRFSCIALTATVAGIFCLANGCASPEEAKTTNNPVPASGTSAASSNASGGSYPGMQGAKLTIPKKTGKDGH